MSGTVIGNYRIICKLGEGGMGQVFRAIDVTLQREVAIKILHPYLTQDEAMLQRFRAEAITLA
ncbi:MAG: serine/threonine protein kinase, partial [Pyrinomonas methylaliphatogenes]|nr:serine/threonine protein kinase [Pyrinomonas methylaliphatogenes]